MYWAEAQSWRKRAGSWPHVCHALVRGGRDHHVGRVDAGGGGRGGCVLRGLRAGGVDRVRNVVSGNQHSELSPPLSSETHMQSRGSPQPSMAGGCPGPKARGPEPEASAPFQMDGCGQTHKMGFGEGVEAGAVGGTIGPPGPRTLGIGVPGWVLTSRPR